jgi:hypothetical protein
LYSTIHCCLKRTRPGALLALIASASRSFALKFPFTPVAISSQALCLLSRSVSNANNIPHLTNFPSQLGVTAFDPEQRQRNSYPGDMTVCNFYPRNACKFGGKQPDMLYRLFPHAKQMLANSSTLEVRGMQPEGEVVLAEAPTTTALVLSVAIATVRVTIAGPAHSGVAANQSRRLST